MNKETMAACALPVLVIGSLNMDLVVTVCQLPQQGETVFGRNFATFPGGKGANQAVAAAKLGARVTMVGCVGQDNFAAELLESLRLAGVETSQVRSVTGKTTGVALITVADKGVNTIVVVAGANQECNPGDVQAALAKTKNPGIVLLQNEVPPATVEYAIRTAGEQGWKVIYNPAPARTVDAGILGLVDILTPNETELAALTGMPVRSQQEAVAAGKKLLQTGVKQIIVTMGAAGALLIAERMVKAVPAIQVQAVDSTAAGDCYTGAVAAGLAEGQPLETALHFAAVAAGLSVTREGAQSALPSKDAVEKYMRKKVKMYEKKWRAE
ncbi:hypothetical protein P22_2029 [Propionispora sp. 2/2-37]|uniref:ribokinase n=1 Tax=Propionispora sp. 2/2-37 TaxID=1677858 RepID=UPI0006C0AD75|nr:ribokinase [Propionispora sp. 2/2-37]CUH95941.1 hypothetical protein P22_2029 [Propionispora sp. 2/2-37]